MFGVFEKRKNQQVKGDGEFSGGFGFREKNPKIIADIEQPEVGQTWETPDGSRLVIKGKKNSGRFEVIIKIIGSPEREQWMEPEVLTAMLASDGYKLIESLLVAAGSEMSVSGTSQETVVVPVREEEVSPTIGNEDEYVSLENETQEIIKKVEIINAAIGKILQENIDAFGEKYAHFLDQLNTFVRLINELTEEDEKLNDTANEPGQKITPEFLEKKKANHRELLDLFAELENLESAVKAEVEKTESPLEENPAPLIVSAEDDAEPLREQTAEVINLDDHRKTGAQLKPAEEKPMTPPFGEGSSEKTEAKKDEPKDTVVGIDAVLPAKKEAQEVSAKERREARERKNAELFEMVSKALKEGQELKKNGKPMLSIVAIAPQGIDIVYKKNATDKERFQPLTIKPSDIKDFLDYLKNTFDWTLEKKERKASKPKTERKEEGVRKDKLPIDKDDAFRASMDQTAIPDYEDVRSSERIAASAVAKTGENIIEQPASQDQSYEEREKSLPVVKRKQFGSVVSEGLAPLVLRTEQDKGVTLRSLVDQIGIEKLAQSIAQSIVTILPVELDWNEEERSLFATEFAKRELTESLE